MMTTKHLTLVPYARVSRMKGRAPEQAERDYKAKLARWAAGQPNVTALAFVADHDTTGGRVTGRAKLDGVLNLIASGGADGVVVPEAKRLGRNLRETINLIYALREGGTVKIAGEDVELPGGAFFLPLDVPGAEDPTDRNSKLALHLWLSIAEHELDGYREQWAVRKRRWAEAGVRIGTAPLGYRHIPHAPGEDPIGLEPDDDPRPAPVRSSERDWRAYPVATAPLIREAFRLLVAEGVEAAGAHLGLPPSRAKPILTNRIYLGETSWAPAAGAPPIIVRGAHPPLVDAATFARALRVLDGHETPGRKPRGNYPLTGVCHCARCGESIVGSISYYRRTYRCGSAGGGKMVKCGPFANLLADELEAHLHARLVEVAREAERAIEEDQPPETLAEAIAAGRGPRGGGLTAMPDLDGARAKVEQAEADLAEAHALPAKFRARAVADAEAALGDVAAAHEAAAAELEGASVLPDWVEVAAAPLAELGRILAKLGVVASVSPERGTVQARATLA